MKVYVTASTERTRSNINLYERLLSTLDEYKFENTNKYFSDIVNRQVDAQNKHNLYDSAIKKLKQSDLLIADISNQSVTLGILIESARSNNIPVLVLCEDTYRDHVPKIFLYRKNSNVFTLLLYRREDLELHLKSYFEAFRKNKIKFNVFISPELDNYMKWYAEKHNFSSKSDFFREFLEEKLENDQDYKKSLS